MIEHGLYMGKLRIKGIDLQSSSENWLHSYQENHSMWKLFKNHNLIQILATHIIIISYNN